MFQSYFLVSIRHELSRMEEWVFVPVKLRSGGVAFAVETSVDAIIDKKYPEARIAHHCSPPGLAKTLCLFT